MPDGGAEVEACPIHGDGPCGTGGVGGTKCCWSHHAVEKVNRRTYRVCFECGHVWTHWSLMRAFHRDLGHWRRPSRIYCCPECIHDW